MNQAERDAELLKSILAALEAPECCSKCLDNPAERSAVARSVFHAVKHELRWQEYDQRKDHAQ